MQIEKNAVVEFNYSLIDENGSLAEATSPQSTAILYGHRSVVPGIERALAGREAGDRFGVTVAPEEGYGPRRDDWTERVSKKYFANASRLRPGVVTQLHTGEGTRPVTVLKVGGKFIDVDLNHPHAGKTLRFDIEIVAVREATADELAHGHVHGPHGAH